MFKGRCNVVSITISLIFAGIELHNVISSKDFHCLFLRLNSSTAPSSIFANTGFATALNIRQPPLLLRFMLSWFAGITKALPTLNKCNLYLELVLLRLGGIAAVTISKL